MGAFLSNGRPVDEKRKIKELIVAYLLENLRYDDRYLHFCEGKEFPELTVPIECFDLNTLKMSWANTKHLLSTYQLYQRDMNIIRDAVKEVNKELEAALDYVKQNPSPPENIRETDAQVAARKWLNRQARYKLVSKNNKKSVKRKSVAAKKMKKKSVKRKSVVGKKMRK